MREENFSYGAHFSKPALPESGQNRPEPYAVFIIVPVFTSLDCHFFMCYVDARSQTSIYCVSESHYSLPICTSAKVRIDKLG